ncbi:Arylsulfatase [Tolypocladium paradoxum]|uniref:Arylsulfatase n=1 Tax=Tolypocladium paradoxum TaxID=94208 RepID=A0A2S4KLA2_9HYPO|nr:Arylsulfatase [Tolypocladium paradoxum]
MRGKRYSLGGEFKCLTESRQGIKCPLFVGGQQSSSRWLRPTTDQTAPDWIRDKMALLSGLFFIGALLLHAGSGYAENPCQARRPNIILILTDDQDLHLGSLDYMKSVQEQLIEKGTSFSNHFATVSQCCPSRASLLRGQHAHNTNLTHVASPGGNYAKWLVSGHNKDYLPTWLNWAGYHTECKFPDPRLEPWAYDYNTPVFSYNGLTPVVYHGYHQTDVIRAKALRHLTEGQVDKPFYLTIAPVAPHVEFGGFPKPQVRHKKAFPKAKAPQHANFNPSDTHARQKPSWLKHLEPLNDSQIDHVNMHFRRRIQALQGVDEIVHDVVEILEENEVLDNTYIIYTTDNGYHLGQHRVMAGKTLPYLEDTNLPFIVRGPGVPEGRTSRLPGTHLDLAPTFLEIACFEPNNFPVYFDGRSLLDNWRYPDRIVNAFESATRDIINVEFWGRSGVEAPGHKGSIDNSYKTIRIVGAESSWLYTRWCTGDTELYETYVRLPSTARLTNVTANQHFAVMQFDAFELDNLAPNAAPGSLHMRMMHRLDALLTATKSCSQDTCRDPWIVLQNSCVSDKSCPRASLFNSIRTAMDPSFDDFFANLPKVQIAECLDIQDVHNEWPYLPPSSSSLGSKHREPTDHYKSPARLGRPVPRNAIDQGTSSQRHTQIWEMEEKARKLTMEELGVSPS